MYRVRTLRHLALSGALLGLSVLPAQAALTLTADGIAAGFSLSTFMNDPSHYYGLINLANAPDGSLIGASYGTGSFVRLNNVDNQTFADVLASTPAGGSPYNTVASGGVVYGGVNGGIYSTISTSLAISPLALTPPATPYLGMWANPVNGHLLSASYSGIIDIDPVAGTTRVVAAVFPDGVTVSPDGKIVYAEIGGAIIGYDIATGAEVFNSGFLPGGPDGTGVISGGVFNGDIIVNNNDGTIGLLDTAGVAPYLIIASGGARGDFVSPDSTTGTLFLFMADATYRLSCGIDCTIGGPPPVGAPEPATLALLSVGLAALGVARRTKRQQR